MLGFLDLNGIWISNIKLWCTDTLLNMLFYYSLKLNARRTSLVHSGKDSGFLLQWLWFPSWSGKIQQAVWCGLTKKGKRKKTDTKWTPLYCIENPKKDEIWPILSRLSTCFYFSLTIIPLYHLSWDGLLDCWCLQCVNNSTCPVL